jgi:uncharacterized protein (TIGR03083 family)
VDTSSLIDTLRIEGGLLADAAGRAEVTATVPTCPGWTVRDLLLHVGGVHRWATMVVGDRCTGPVDIDQPYDIVAELPADDGLLAWFRAGHADLVRTLSEAPADTECWAFLPAPSPLAFWARRQAHETTVHRTDAEAAAHATTTPVTTPVAADGVDELLTCFVSGRNRRLRANRGWTLLVHATDVATRWRVRVGPELPRVDRVTEDVPADWSVAGPAASLYLALWNRRPWTDLTVTGGTSAELADRWASGVHVRWA